MKKLHTLKTTLCMVLFVTVLGCNNASAQITEIIKEFNKQMPMSLGIMGEMTKVSVNGNYFEMTCSVNEDVVNLPALKNNPDLMHDNLVQMVTNSNIDGMDFIIGELVKSKLGMKMTYIGKTSRAQVTATLNANEIKQRSNQSSSKNPIELLDSQIRLTNIQLPMDLGNNMTLDRMVREKNYLVYYYSWTDDMVDLLNLSKDEMKTEIKKSLKSDDPSFVMMKNMCKDAGIGMAFCYVGRETGKKCTIRVSYKEL